MIEDKGDLWTYPTDWICITTNGMMLPSDNTRAVMGAGIAKQARDKIPDIDKVLADSLMKNGNNVRPLIKWESKWILSFPTKGHWKDPAFLWIIEKSAKQLKEGWDKQYSKPTVVLPPPGCGNGGLNWEDVKHVLEKYFTSDKFVVINNDRHKNN